VSDANNLALPAVSSLRPAFGIYYVLKQILVSVVVIVAAAAGYIFLVPGAAQTLARYGITLPVEAAPSSPEAVTAAPQAGGQQPALRQAGPGGGRGGNRAPVVVTAPVTLATINDRLFAIGEGAAAQAVTVTSPATGTLNQLVVAPGDVIAAGAVIAHLDADAEEIAFRRARLALEDAETTLARTQELANANSATTVQLNTAQLAASNARLEAENAELALTRRSISTPIGGTVGLFQVSPGNAVTAQTVVTTIVDTSHIRISFWVPERYASSITVGMPVAVSAVALPGEDIAGEVSAVDNRIDSASRTLQVEARIANDDGRLRPGMSFSVTMTFAGEQFPSVDPLSIQWSSDGPYLWKYAEGGVERVPVQIIQRNSNGVLVKGALQDGDQVVTQGLQQLTAGASVRLLDEVVAGQRQGEGGGGPVVRQGQGG
jgi:RND family efflux transporter MFP subunit